MKLISAFQKGVNAFIDHVNTPQSFVVGERFEDYVEDSLFIDNYYDTLDRTHDYITNKKNFIKSSLKPDFTFWDKWARKEFYLEVKFRSNELYQGKICWCNENQLSRYYEYNKKKPVFILIGLGDNPGNPDSVLLIPLAHAKYTGLYPSIAERFEIEPDGPVTSKALWSR